MSRVDFRRVGLRDPATVQELVRSILNDMENGPGIANSREWLAAAARGGLAAAAVRSVGP